MKTSRASNRDTTTMSCSRSSLAPLWELLAVACSPDSTRWRKHETPESSQGPPLAREGDTRRHAIYDGPRARGCPNTVLSQGIFRTAVLRAHPAGYARSVAV